MYESLIMLVYVITVLELSLTQRCNKIRLLCFPFQLAILSWRQCTRTRSPECDFFGLIN